jgi:hypothetical protein
MGILAAGAALRTRASFAMADRASTVTGCVGADSGREQLDGGVARAVYTGNNAGTRQTS